jgi:hypothetical protein
MDVPRLPLNDLAADLRARTGKTQERLELPPGTTAAPQRPVHGGVTAAPRTQNGATRDALARDRRRSQAMLAAFLGLPDDGEVEVDVDVDVQGEHATFRFRDRATGALLRETPEAEARALVARLQQNGGALIDRAV